ncbi:hypothetical protein BDZ88DRAFT_509231 [Geranomyces variabilis]|nr:hypothetical protein BDZ88DRAFT_509231 [Geranomyces variabilis]KAJ3136718.1 hypothetical protein HDU90_003096 [Geranomyces variabilis]
MSPAADDERARRAEAAKLRVRRHKAKGFYRPRFPFLLRREGLKQFQSGRAARSSLDGRPSATVSSNSAAAAQPPEAHDAARIAAALSRRSSRQSEAGRGTSPGVLSPTLRPAALAATRVATTALGGGVVGQPIGVGQPAPSPPAASANGQDVAQSDRSEDVSTADSFARNKNPALYPASHTEQAVLAPTPPTVTHPAAQSESTQTVPNPTSQQPDVDRTPHSSPDLKSALDAANAKLASYEAELELLRTNISAQTSDANHRGKLLEQELTEEKAKAFKALETVTELRREREERRHASDETQSRLSTATKDGAELAEALAAEKSANAELAREVEELRTRVAEQDDAAAATRDELATVSATCEELTAALAFEKEQRRSSDSKIEELVTILEAEKQLAAKMQSEFTTVHDAGSELKAALTAEKEKVARWEQEIDKLRREMEEMERDAERRRDAQTSDDSAAELRAALNTERKQVVDLREENAHLREEVEGLQHDLDARNAAEEALRAERASAHETSVDDIRKEFSEKIADAVASADRYRAEADEWRSKCESMTQNIENGQEAEKARALLIRAESEEEMRALKDTLAMEDESLTAERARTAELETSLAVALEELRSRPDAETLDAIKAETARTIGEAAGDEKATMAQEIDNLRAALAELERTGSQDKRRAASPGSSGRSTSNSGTSSDSAGNNGTEGSDSSRRFAALQADYAALQAELERVRLAQADIGPLLLRTGMAPSVSETVASFQRRCDELSVLVQAAEKERNGLKVECERLKTAAWDGERAEARAHEVASEMASLREGIERERGLWVAKEELMKGDLADTKDQLASYAKLLEGVWGTLQDDAQSSGDEPATTQRRRERGGWRNGALEKALANLLEDRKRIRESEAEAHLIIDLQHEKIERMIKGDGATPFSKPGTPVNTAINSSAVPPRTSRDGSPMPGRYALDYLGASPAAPAVETSDGETQTDPMLAYQRITTLKARLTELGTIWKIPHSAPVSFGPPPEDAESRLAHLAAAHAEIQSAHAAALQRVASLEASLGNAKRLVVALSTGADADRAAGGDAGEDDERDEEVWMRKCLALEGDARQLEDEVRRWRERAEELEEIVEEWSLGSATSP